MESENQNNQSTSTDFNAAMSMKIEADGITFYTLMDFGLFLREYDLFGKVKLFSPLLDRTGKVLYKENLYLKDSIYRKLEEMEGQYEPVFKVSLTSELLIGIRRSIGEKMLLRLNAPENKFIAQLYEGTLHPYKEYVRNSMTNNRSLIMTFFKLARDKKQFFNHLADLGLLTLGVMIQKAYKIRFINRNAFLAGLCLDLPFAGSTVWNDYPEDERLRIKMAQKSCIAAEKLNLAPEISDAILNSPVLPSVPLKTHKPIASSIDINIETGMEHILENEQESIQDTQTSSTILPVNENLEMAKMILTEVLKISRYIDSIKRRIDPGEEFAEELVYMVAYNAARGYFHKELINPIIKKFKQYEEAARRMMRIAEIENQCIYPPSAWAYPKPRASQVLCKNRVNECPMLDPGWEISVVSRQDAFGWIGTNLRPGIYPKCKLEEQLDIHKQPEGSKPPV